MKRIIPLIVFLIFSVSCFKPQDYKVAMNAFKMKKWDEAAKHFGKLVLDHPDNIEYKVKWEMAKNNASKLHIKKGKQYELKKEYDKAIAEYKIALMYDPTNQYVFDRVNAINAKIEKIKEKAARKEYTIAKAKQKAYGKNGIPVLNPSSNEPIDLYFPRPTSLKKIYHALGKASGINILFDESFQDKQIAIDLRGMTFYNALKALMIASGNFYKIIDEKTVIILRDTKQNHQKYDDKIIKVYYLSYAKPDKLKNNLRLLTGIKEIFDDKDLNCVVVMGTPQQINIADRIVKLTDRPKSEITIDFDLMEVNRSNLDKLGLLPTDLQNPAYKVGAGLIPNSSGDEGNTGGNGFINLDNATWMFAIPYLQVDFLKSIGKAKEVANPTLRVSEGEKAKVLIGQSVPIATTSFTPFTGISGTNNNSVAGIGGQPLTSYNYQEVGIKIEVEPRVHHNGDVTLKLKLEVSSIVDKTAFQPVIGKRTVETVVRVKSGETVMLAGLLKNSERTSLNGIKGLADLPVLKELFSNTSKEVQQTDIMMTITPHIVRGPNIVEDDLLPYSVGSEVESNFPPEGFIKKEEKQEESIPEPAKPKTEKQLKMGKNKNDKIANKGGESLNSVSLTPAIVSFSPKRSVKQAGANFSVTLFATNFKDIDNTDLVITFDPKVVKVLNVMDGGFMKQDGVDASFVPVWDNRNGKIAITIDRRGGEKGRSGTGILANIIFQAISPGKCTLKFEPSSTIKNFDDMKVHSTFINGEVIVK
ncbi:general secretion pathway protein D [Thermotomaculum hydrothermale]|uniref:General secretion pathway protein D n=1 Tax=Thermotomaculum hydrothermale TaxID=981385 RepID=A0A7R6PTP5_9BACT|nr:cohesin domain-containing protein [Thermotomaculum hydrothermale]BBB32472.1 general secretion pathway protein D [Thermotomaculum hydrothermale]